MHISSADKKEKPWFLKALKTRRNPFFDKTVRKTGFIHMVREMRLELTRRLPHAPQTCLSTYSSTLAYNFRLLSYYTHSFCICQVFYFFLAAFWPDVPSLFYLRFVPISGIIPTVCILRKAGEAVAEVFCFAERCARKLFDA